MKPSKTSKQWMQEHVSDPWVRKAKAEGYRSRAAFKLTEIDHKDKLLHKGQVVVELGAAPGSWTQIVARKVLPGGCVIALDLLPFEPIPGVEFIQGDFAEDAILAELGQRLNNRPVDLVLSDIAPNISGIATIDQGRMLHLAELALDFADQHLRPGGNMLIKLFQGAGFMEYRKAMQALFASVQTRKPEASRDRSAEVYLLGLRRNSVN
ncbi:MAG: RlmE family RNA methyltransferase [Betaproteobacteria bacterium]|nr:RlmE family RNA methyltransferase [Betaproteobacteria bacterium]